MFGLVNAIEGGDEQGGGTDLLHTTIIIIIIILIPMEYGIVFLSASAMSMFVRPLDIKISRGTILGGAKS